MPSIPVYLTSSLRIIVLPLEIASTKFLLALKEVAFSLLQLPWTYSFLSGIY